MAAITINVTIENGGTGIVFINIDENNLSFKQSGNQTIQLDPNDYIATVTGTEPSDATVSIQINQGNNCLKKADFSDTVFSGWMPFTVS